MAMSRGYLRRDAHRRALNLHTALLVLGLGIAFGLNRSLTPDHFWAHWIALAWGVVFLGHLAIFARATLATMGRKRP